MYTYPTVSSFPTFRPGVQRVAALLDLHGVGFFKLADSLTGYGRTNGYDSLANARRAAFNLSVGAASPAAGVYRMGDRYFVRALVASPGVNPHDVHTGATAVQAPAKPNLSLLHFEGNGDAHFAWISDPRLVLMVDGSTRIWSKDAHHTPPAQIPSI